MKTSNNYADIEISLLNSENSYYSVDFRFIDPESETDVRLQQGKTAFARFDLQKLGELVYEPESYGKLLSEGLFADPSIKNAFENARVRVRSGADKVLRFRLLIGSNASELHRLHWEMLRDPQDAIPAVHR